MAKLGISTEGGAEGVTVLEHGFPIDPLLQKRAACIFTMTYNESWQVVDAGYAPDDFVVFKYSDQGAQILEDGRDGLEDRLEDPEFVDRMARIVAASNRGWAWAPVESRRCSGYRAGQRRTRRTDQRAPEAHDRRGHQAAGAPRIPADWPRPATSARFRCCSAACHPW